MVDFLKALLRVIATIIVAMILMIGAVIVATVLLIIALAPFFIVFWLISLVL